MRRLLVALLLVSFAGPQALVGQRSASSAHVAPGARVRVTQPREQPRIAVVVAHTSDTLFVRWISFADTVAVPLGQISRLEVSTGRHRSVGKGAAIGGLIGGATGALASALTYSPCEGFCLYEPADRGEATVWGGVAGGALGAVVGSLIGLKTHEEWQRVSLTPRLVSSRVSGTGFGITLAF